VRNFDHRNTCPPSRRRLADGAPYLVPLSSDWDGEALLVATPTDRLTSKSRIGGVVVGGDGGVGGGIPTISPTLWVGGKGEAALTVTLEWSEHSGAPAGGDG
jgi:hypothetical protein